MGKFEVGQNRAYMYVSQAMAQAIVDEISSEINEHINMMDGSGRIIASTDPLRIGSIHEGAKKIVEEHLSQLYITPEMQTVTTKVGINLPITVNNEIVGVIGITGKKEQVEKFGNIVRHITEILVEDSVLKDEQRLDRRVKYRFLESWIKDDGMAMNPKFIERGMQLNIDIKKPRRVIIFRLDNFIQLSAKLEGQRKMESIETLIRNRVSEIQNALYLREPTRQICFLPVCSNEEINMFANTVSKEVESKFEEKILAGVDGHLNGNVLLRKSCEEAGKALDTCTIQDRWLTFYNELNIEIFLDEVSESSKREYLSKLFGTVTVEEMEYFMKVIEAYFDCDGSISTTAERMFMHKNTLQYKIHKIEEITGHDIRKPIGSSILYMALEFYHSLYGGNYILRV